MVVIKRVLKTLKILGYRIGVFCSVAVLTLLPPGSLGAPLQRVDFSFVCRLVIGFQRWVYTIGRELRSGGVNRVWGACVSFCLSTTVRRLE
jgi:hypothetical protein